MCITIILINNIKVTPVILLSIAAPVLRFIPDTKVRHKVQKIIAPINDRSTSDVP